MRAAGDALALIASIPGKATNYGSNGSWDPRVAYLDFLVKLGQRHRCLPG